MTTKQLLISTLILSLILSAVINNALAEDKVFTKGWDNKLNKTYLSFALINRQKTTLDNIKIIEKIPHDRFYAITTIGLLKKTLHPYYQEKTLRCITSNNAIICGPDMILLDSTDPNDCEKLRNEYEEFKEYSWLEKKNNN